MTGTSSFAKQMSRKVKHISGSKDVLIIGEPGTGRRHLAREIHQTRSRNGAFILLDGSSVSFAEVQAVLAGRNRESVRPLTGHDAAKLSKQATVCVAGIDSLGAREQSVVAEFLQEQRKEYAGLRVILTAQDVAKISFDVSAFERMEIPPLRDRSEDIPDLVVSILKSLGKESFRVSDGTFRVLGKSPWAGNISELSKLIGKGVLISSGDELQLPDEYLDVNQHLQNAIESIAAARVFSLDKSLWLIEKLLIEKLLAVTQNNQSAAAGIVGLSEANFRYRLKKFGIKSVREKKGKNRGEIH